MLNPFKPLELIKAEVFMSMPAKFRRRQRTKWSDPNRQNIEVECFLEGPAFDREGNLYFVDTPFGRIFRITTQGEWELVVQYDGWPNGMKFHKDGRLFIADYRRGLLCLDTKTAQIETILETAYSEGFKGLNDLHFTSTGDLYFTDQGQTGIADPTGRLFRLRADGGLDRLVTNIPSPNGVTVSTTEKHIYVGVTRSQQVWRLPVMHDLAFSKTGVAIQLSGGVGGPDGIEMDAENGLLVCQLGVGVWRFDSNMLPTHLIYSESDRHHHLANVAFGGPDRRTVYITDSLSGDILKAELPVAGKLLYGHQ
jgi:gluconolactonase